MKRKTVLQAYRTTHQFTLKRSAVNKLLPANNKISHLFSNQVANNAIVLFTTDVDNAAHLFVAEEVYWFQSAVQLCPGFHSFLAVDSHQQILAVF